MTDMPDRLPSRPLRNWFLAWHIHTGDPADVIAKGFDLDPVLVAAFLGGQAPLMIRADEAVEVCLKVRMAPAAIWPRVERAASKQPRECDPLAADVPTSLTRALVEFR